MYVYIKGEYLFDYSKEKDTLLLKERGIGFELIIEAINSALLDIVDHPNQNDYPKQKMYIVEALNYVYIVPFVREGDIIFLKTIIPSRKAKKKYKG